MVTARQYFGDPIDCISKDDIPSNLLDTFCWIHTTFSIQEAWDKKVGSEVPYPGVDKSTTGKKVYHAYYQWVCFVLFFQALFFYVPRYIWKNTENHRCKNLMLKLDNPLIGQQELEDNTKLLVGYLSNNHTHNTNFYIYVFTEFLNLLNVTVQMFVMNRFLGGEFMQYGFQVLSFTEWDPELRYDPMLKIFPRLTKCTFHRFGSSGDVQTHDAMCILPINIINEKIYIFLWFWFVFVFIASLMSLIFRLATIFVIRLRYVAIQTRARLVKADTIKTIVDKSKIGDWFLLDLLAKNLDPMNYKYLLEQYHNHITSHKDVGGP